MIRLLFVLMLLVAPVGAHAQDKAQDKPDFAQSLIKAAREQIGVTVTYDPAYVSIPFPGGDVPMDRGVCTDVVVRAYRGVGADLQLLVNRDMHKAFRSYPRAWGLKRPDANIDHRRVLNLNVFFKRHGKSLPITQEPADYKPGDIVAWTLPDGRPHIGLVTDKKEGDTPLIVHNIGWGAREENILFTLKIIGHFRYAPKIKEKP
ncbi:MAG: DUF1287 domain-containing protein [Alphaproteobacteria bacterium]